MRVIVSQDIALCALRVLGQYLVSAYRRLSQSFPLAHLVKVIWCSATFTLRPVTLLCDGPSTGKSQVLLCAATFKFRCHFIFLFSWSLAFSRPKNGPDRITGSHSAVKRRSQRTARHATTWQRRHRVSDGPSAPLPHIQSPNTLCICPYSAHTCPSTQLTMPCSCKHHTGHDMHTLSSLTSHPSRRCACFNLDRRSAQTLFHSFAPRTRQSPCPRTPHSNQFNSIQFAFSQVRHRLLSHIHIYIACAIHSVCTSYCVIATGSLFLNDGAHRSGCVLVIFDCRTTLK